MTARTVVGTVVLPGGDAPAWADVVVDLYASTSGRAVGWVPTADLGVGGQLYVHCDTAGSWSVDLEPNATITPTGSAYRIRYSAGKWSTTFYIEVPDTAGPHRVEDILVDEPAGLASAPLSEFIDTFDGGTRGQVLTRTSTTAYGWKPPTLLGPTYMVIGDEESERWESWPWLMMIRSGGRITYTQHPDNSVSGATAASSLATFMQWQVPTPPSFAIICFNGRELITGTVAQFVADMKTLIAAVQAAGSVPVLTTVLPRTVADSNYTTAIRAKFAAAGMWIKNYAALAGLPMVDFYGLLADPTTGVLKSKYIFNSAYFNQTAQRDMADLMLATLSPYLRPWRAMSATFDGDPNNLIANAFSLPDTNADGVADGWTAQYTGAGTTFSIVADDRFKGGKAIQIAADSPTTTAQLKSANVNASGTAVSAGDVVAFMADYSIESSSGVGLGAESGEGLQFYSVCPGVLPFFSNHRMALTGSEFDDPAMPGPLRYSRTPQLNTFCGLTYFPVDTEPNPNFWTRSDVSMMFRISGLTTGQAMTIRIGNLGIYNLTKMGIVEPTIGYAAGAWNWYNVYVDPVNHAYWLAGS